MRPDMPAAASRVTTLTGLVVGLVLLSAAPASAQTGGHGGHGVSVAAAGEGWVAVVLRCVVLTASAAVAGVALLRPLSGPPGPRTGRVLLGAAAIAAGGLAFSVPTLGTATIWALGQATVTLLAAALLPRAIPAVGAGVLLVTALGWEAVIDRTGSALLLGWVHTVSASVWLAAAVLVVAGEPGTRRVLLRRHIPVAVAAALVLAGTGVVRAWQAQLRPDATSAGSLFGQLVVAKTVLFVAAVVLAVLAYRRLTGSAHVAAHRRFPERSIALLGRAGVTVLAVALLAGASLAALDPPVAAGEAGKPVVRTVAVGARPVPVVVAPHRPGPNLVYVGALGYRVGTDPEHFVDATVRRGATGGWAVIDLPAGRSQLWISGGEHRVPLRLDAAGPATPLGALTGPDGPECLTAVMGGFATGRTDGALPVRCPADVLVDSDAATLRTLVGFLGRRGRSVHPVADGSPRSMAALAEVHQAAAERGVRVDGAAEPASTVLLLGGWEQADQLLVEYTRSAAPGGIYLAPWLATAPLLRYSTGAITALRFDPRGELAARYLAALRARAVPALASPAGLAGWLGGVAVDPRSAIRLYASARVAVLPAEFGHAHSAQDGWMPGGTLTPVTAPLPEP